MSDKFYFTVETLIEVLKEMPSDLPVLVSGYKSGFENFYHPQSVILKHEPDNWFEDGEFQLADEDEPDTFEAVIFGRVNRDD